MFNYAIPAYVSIVYGAIRLDLQTIPPKTIIRGSVTDIPANFTLNNNILGATSSFVFKVNGITIDEQANINISPRSFNYSLRNIIFDGNLFPSVYAGERFYFEAYASTVLNGVEIKSNTVIFDMTVVEADSLIIVTNDISENDSNYESITKYSQGSQLNFTYYLSYAPTKYSTFNIDYNIYLASGSSRISEEPLLSGRIPNVTKGNTNIFSLSTVTLPINSENEYLEIEMFASAVSDSGDTSAQFTKSVYAAIVEAVKVDLYANNKLETLLAYYSRATGFPSANEKV